MKSIFVIIMVIVIAIGEGDASFYDNVVGTVRDLTTAVKNDAYNLWSYGKELVIGENEADNGVAGRSLNENTSVATSNVETKGIYGRVKNHIKGIRESSYNILFGDTGNVQKKGFLSAFCDKMSNKFKQIFALRNQSTVNIPKPTAPSLYNNNDMRNVNEVLDKVLISKQLEKLASNLNVWEDILTLRNQIREAKNGFQTSDISPMDSRSGPGRTILDDEYNKPTLDDGYYKFTDRDGKSVYRVGNNGFDDGDLVRRSGNRINELAEKFEGDFRTAVNSIKKNIEDRNQK